MGWESFVEAGRRDEAFVSWLLEEQLHWEVIPASTEEDIHAHVDFWCVLPKADGRFGVDVKGMKKLNRYDSIVSDTITWLEFRNVHGDSGWLYGQARYIAFRRFRCVALVDRAKLLAFALGMVQGKPTYQCRPNNCWELYTRSRYGRNDLMCMAPLDTIQSLAEIVIPLPNHIPQSLQG